MSLKDHEKMNLFQQTRYEKKCIKQLILDIIFSKKFLNKTMIGMERILKYSQQEKQLEQKEEAVEAMLVPQHS